METLLRVGRAMLLVDFLLGWMDSCTSLACRCATRRSISKSLEADFDVGAEVDFR
jgi:hypothetical protein